MNLPIQIKQPEWVLLSASADHNSECVLVDMPTNDAINSWNLIKNAYSAILQNDHDAAQRELRTAITNNPNDLLLNRTINVYYPDLLIQNSNLRLNVPSSNDFKLAIVIPGELRCFKKTRDFIEELGKYADIYICTSAKYAEVARTISCKLQVVEYEPNLPVASMHQWHKLNLCLQMVREEEEEHDISYTHILKIRSDFFLDRKSVV